MAQKQPTPDLFTIPQAADLLGTSRQAVHDAIKQGRLPAFRYGHTQLIPASKLLEYKKSRRPGGPKPTRKRSK